MLQLVQLLLAQSSEASAGGLPSGIEQVDQFSGVISRNGLYAIISALAFVSVALFGFLMRQGAQRHKDLREHAAKLEKLQTDHGETLQRVQSDHQRELLAVVSEQTKAITRQIVLNEAMQPLMEKSARAMQNLVRKGFHAKEDD